jgi:ATP phosphoribosyltransferase
MTVELAVSIVCALIAAAASITVALIANAKSSKKTREELAAEVVKSNNQVIEELKKTQIKLELTQELQKQQIEELTREVREHNNFAKRMPAVELGISELHRELDAKVGFLDEKMDLLHKDDHK